VSVIADIRGKKMNWNPFKPFGRERTEVADILETGFATGAISRRQIPGVV
jgi:hypothetical protein